MSDFAESEENRELLASYALGDLTPEEVIEVHKLLETHPELQQELEQLQETLALLPLALPQINLPPDLGSEILQKADADSNDVSQQLHRQKLWLGAIATFMTGVAIALGFYGYSLQERLKVSEKDLGEYKAAISLLKQQSKVVFSLKSTKTSYNASGSLLLLNNSKIGLLSVDRLKPLPPGKIYRVWAADKQRKIYCGEFNSDKDGKVLVQMLLKEAINNPSFVIITIESGSRINSPKGETVMSGSTSN